MAEQLTWEHYVGTMATALGIDESDLTRETHLYDDIGVDSLGIFSIGMKLIKVYNVKLPLALVSNLKTVGDIYDAMDNRRDAGSALPES
jgi:acyl carrier protein